MYNTIVMIHTVTYDDSVSRSIHRYRVLLDLDLEDNLDTRSPGQ